MIDTDFASLTVTTDNNTARVCKDEVAERESQSDDGKPNDNRGERMRQENKTGNVQNNCCPSMIVLHAQVATRTPKSSPLNWPTRDRARESPRPIYTLKTRNKSHLTGWIMKSAAYFHSIACVSGSDENTVPLSGASWTNLIGPPPPPQRHPPPTNRYVRNR